MDQGRTKYEEPSTKDLFDEPARGGNGDDLTGSGCRGSTAVAGVLDQHGERDTLLGRAVRRISDEPGMRLRAVYFCRAGLSGDAPRMLTQPAAGAGEHRVA